MLVKSIECVELSKGKRSKDSKSSLSICKKNNSSKFRDTFNSCITELNGKEEFKN